jgi:hypothetical protein
MNRLPSRPSRSARRNAETWTVRLAGSTNRFGQTRAINSRLVTNSPGRSSKTISICMARLPRGTGLSRSSRRNCAGSKRKGPNEISRVFAPAGLPVFRWLVSGLWRGRLTSKLALEFNRSNTGTSAIDKRSEAAVDPDKAIVVSSIAVSPAKLSVILCSSRECRAFPAPNARGVSRRSSHCARRRRT